MPMRKPSSGKIGSRNTDPRIIELHGKLIARKGSYRLGLEQGRISYTSFLDTYKRLIESLVTIGETNDIITIIKAERAFVSYDLEYFARNPLSKSSLKAGLEQLAELERLLGYWAEDPQKYHAWALKTHCSKSMTNGLPRDGIRILMAVHIRRLNNMFYGMGEEPDIVNAWVTARLANLRKADRLYRESQQSVPDDF